MLLTIDAADSSKFIYNTRSPRPHAAWGNTQAKVLFPAPAVPTIRMPVPRLAVGESVIEPGLSAGHLGP